MEKVEILHHTKTSWELCEFENNTKNQLILPIQPKKNIILPSQAKIVFFYRV